MKQLLINIFGLDRLYRIRKSRIINLLPRVLRASRVYNYRYGQIARWAVSSREDTNYTYDLTPENLLYLAHTLAVVVNTKPEQVMAYLEEGQNDAALREHILTKIHSSAYKRVADERVAYGRRLGWYALVRLMKPNVVVETGVDKGQGAVLLCAALLRNRAEGQPGRYYGTDIAPKAGYLLTGPYRETGEILYGDSIESLTALDARIDILINDSDHSADYEYREYLTIANKLNPTSILLSDNAHLTGKLAQFSLETGRKFLFFAEVPQDHWYPGGGIGFSYL